MSKYCAVENQSSWMFSPGDRFQRMARPVSVAVSQRPQQQGIGHTEHGGRRADTYGKGDDRGEGQAFEHF